MSEFMKSNLSFGGQDGFKHTLNGLRNMKNNEDIEEMKAMLLGIDQKIDNAINNKFDSNVLDGIAGGEEMPMGSFEEQNQGESATDEEYHNEINDMEGEEEEAIEEDGIIGLTDSEQVESTDRDEDRALVEHLADENFELQKGNDKFDESEDFGSEKSDSESEYSKDEEDEEDEEE